MRSQRARFSPARSGRPHDQPPQRLYICAHNALVLLLLVLIVLTISLAIALLRSLSLSSFLSCRLLVGRDTVDISFHTVRSLYPVVCIAARHTHNKRVYNNRNPLAPQRTLNALSHCNDGTPSHRLQAS
jgi:hypothetical protein